MVVTYMLLHMYLHVAQFRYKTRKQFTNCIIREKGRDLTQPCDKSPYAHRKIQKAT